MEKDTPENKRAPFFKTDLGQRKETSKRKKRRRTKTVKRGEERYRNLGPRKRGNRKRCEVEKGGG